jgi:hypothetical protein
MRKFGVARASFLPEVFEGIPGYAPLGGIVSPSLVSDAFRKQIQFFNGRVTVCKYYSYVKLPVSVQTAAAPQTLCGNAWDSRGKSFHYAREEALLPHRLFLTRRRIVQIMCLLSYAYRETYTYTERPRRVPIRHIDCLKMYSLRPALMAVA